MPVSVCIRTDYSCRCCFWVNCVITCLHTLASSTACCTWLTLQKSGSRKNYPAIDLENSEIIFSQFSAFTIPLATKIPTEPSSIAFATSAPETIPAPQSSFELLFVSFSMDAAFVISSGLCFEIAFPNRSARGALLQYSLHQILHIF